jgi:RNA recognition motif-containing protein
MNRHPADNSQRHDTSRDIRGFGSNGAGPRTGQNTDRRNSPSLFIGGLAYEVTEESLRSVFTTAINIRVQKDRETGRSRGFGFIEFPTKDTCLEALNQFNGREIAGRRIRLSETTNSGVSEARPVPAPAYTRRSRSRSRERRRSPSSSASEIDETARESLRAARRERMKQRVYQAGTAWDRQPTADELKAQEEERKALTLANARGEITTIRADLQKASASRQAGR